MVLRVIERRQSRGDDQSDDVKRHKTDDYNQRIGSN
jgi:hypothetical protein